MFVAYHVLQKKISTLWETKGWQKTVQWRPLTINRKVWHAYITHDVRLLRCKPHGTHRLSPFGLWRTELESEIVMLSSLDFREKIRAQFQPPRWRLWLMRLDRLVIIMECSWMAMTMGIAECECMYSEVCKAGSFGKGSRPATCSK